MKDKFLDNIGFLVANWLDRSEDYPVVQSIVDRAKEVIALMLKYKPTGMDCYTLARSASFFDEKYCPIEAAEPMDNLVKAIVFFALTKAAKVDEKLENSRNKLWNCSGEHCYIRTAAKLLELPEPEELTCYNVAEKRALPSEIVNAIKDNKREIHIHIDAGPTNGTPLLNIENNDGGKVTIQNTEIKKDGNSIA